MADTNAIVNPVAMRRPCGVPAATLRADRPRPDDRRPSLRLPTRWRGIALAVGAGIAASVGLAVTMSLAKDKSAGRSRRVSVEAESPHVDARAPAAASSTFGDWVVRCQPAGAPPRQERGCETTQTIVMKSQGAPIAQIAMTRAGKQTLTAVVLLPVNVSFQSGVRMIGTDNASGATLGWQRCLPGACVAAATLPAAIVTKLHDGGRLVYQQAGGRQMVLPLSFNGFDQSLDALDAKHSEDIGLK